MVFPAVSIHSGINSIGPAKDVIPITASSTNNIFGVAYNAVNGGDARCCRALLASAAMTITCVTATGATRTGVPLPAGLTSLEVIQVTSISAGTLWALI